MFRLGINWSISHSGRFGNDALDALARLGTKGVNFVKFLSLGGCVWAVLLAFAGILFH